MRCDLHPLLIAPRIGDEVELVLSDEVVVELAAAGTTDAVGLARAIIDAGARSVPATVVLGTARSVRLANGEQIEVCAADHLMHLRCELLSGERLLCVRAQDCDLPIAPAEAEAALGL